MLSSWPPSRQLCKMLIELRNMSRLKTSCTYERGCLKFSRRSNAWPRAWPCDTSFMPRAWYSQKPLSVQPTTTTTNNHTINIFPIWSLCAPISSYYLCFYSCPRLSSTPTILSYPHFPHTPLHHVVRRSSSKGSFPITRRGKTSILIFSFYWLILPRRKHL